MKATKKSQGGELMQTVQYMSSFFWRRKLHGPDGTGKWPRAAHAAQVHIANVRFVYAKRSLLTACFQNTPLAYAK
jgi:hypothetical protein